METHTTNDVSPGNTPRLLVQSLAKTYGSGPKAVEVIEDLTFSVHAGELVCIVGPSGVGKTTLLKCLAGLQPSSGGTMAIDGRKVSGPPAEMALVFQDYSRSLMPWLTVEKNLQLPLRHLRLPAREMRSRVEDALGEVGLSHAAKRYPWQLSGGMQQRAAIARALAYRPEILIMDEPFASVDAQTRFELEDLCLKIRDELGMTILLVTHDIDEAVYLSDRIVAIGHKPARVLEVMDVVLPSPRNQIDTRALPEFSAQRTKVLSLIRQAQA
ncbi:ABC transporter ATP-binding protein [Glutamicibacter sp. MNS18]|uniref:ABC transporter ATP-binding protein n=1 Tax=Glutamicibacter sp. MNS18 TaxID=2989817 RepID=UPI0022366E65|nr:ABC transporter ATP-binding protein [Glutamicibacter sp. MNS18]MCW4465592.1 ABC transporter ATP-binding protein [Glutamicibacter sp. MNS18]